MSTNVIAMGLCCVLLNAPGYVIEQSHDFEAKKSLDLFLLYLMALSRASTEIVTCLSMPVDTRK